MRVEDVGKSECHPVMGWIGVVNVTPRETGQTSDRSFTTRKLTEPLERREANED